VYVGTRGHGILRSRDGLRSWEPVETPAALQKVRSLYVDGERFLAGIESVPEPVGVFEWQDQEEWHRLGDLAACSGSSEWWYPRKDVGVHIRHLAVDPHVRDRMYAAVQVGGVAISPDGGSSWRDRRNLDLDVHMVEADPRRPGVVYAGSGGGGLYKSADYGDTWQCVSEGCGNFVVQFAIDPRDSDRLYLGTGRGGAQGGRGEMWRSDDAGANWRKLRGGLPEELRCRIGAVHVDGDAPDNVFFSGDLPRGNPDSAVYHSPDAGETWRVLAPLPQVVSLCSVQL
jgi:photosystem II stability/assembly factor-like uncharacterized protein